MNKRIGVSEIVPVAVVEGETDEAPLLALLETPRGLVERDDVQSLLLDLVEHGIEEFGRDLEDAVRRKGLRLRRPDMVQREDHAGALGIGREQAMGAGMIKPRHGCLQHGSFHTGHGRVLLRPQIAAARPNSPDRPSRRSPPACS